MKSAHFFCSAGSAGYESEKKIVTPSPSVATVGPPHSAVPARNAAVCGDAGERTLSTKEGETRAIARTSGVLRAGAAAFAVAAAKKAASSPGSTNRRRTPARCRRYLRGT